MIHGDGPWPHAVTEDTVEDLADKHSLIIHPVPFTTTVMMVAGFCIAIK